MSNRKLLLADDSVTIQKVVNLTFADEGVDVVTFGDGDSALATIRDVRPDIVLADVHMPGANGYQICEALRSAEDTRHIPVILLVGSFEPFDEQEAERVGANSFMTKPFQSIRQLVVQVNELLGPVESATLEPDAEPSDEIEIPMNARPEKADDIESLYHQSVTGSASHQDIPQTPELGDQGMDDEMIETSYGDRSEEPDPLTYDENRPVFEREASTYENESLNQPHSSDYQSGDSEDVPEPSHHTSWEPALPPVAERPTEWEPEQPPPVERSESSWEPEQPPPVWEAEPHSQPEPQYYSEPEHGAGGYSQSAEQNEASAKMPGFDQQAATEEYPSGAAGFESIVQETPNYMGQETVAFSTNELELPPSRPSFEEIELLDLPPVGDGRTLELTTVERAELMGSAKQVVSLSPELMEIIVQKVVERLSQKY